MSGNRSEMVARVARAISRATSVDLHGGKLTDYAADDWRDFEGEARAAIAAIHSAGGVEEPTDAMIEAGCDAMHKIHAAMRDRELSDEPENMDDFDEGDVCQAIYLAMHRAALESTGKCAGYTSTESIGCVWHDIGRPCQTDGCKVCGSAAKRRKAEERGQ